MVRRRLRRPFFRSESAFILFPLFFSSREEGGGPVEGNTIQTHDGILMLTC